jgi:hypothetical protein
MIDRPNYYALIIGGFYQETKYISKDKLLLQELAMDEYYDFVYTHYFFDSMSDYYTVCDPVKYWRAYKNLPFYILDITDKYI